MVKYNLVSDVSSHNSDELDFFKTLARRGVRAVIVKLTEGSNPGTAYFNPKAKKQIENAWKAGLRVHAYHFAQYFDEEDAMKEAMWFTEKAKELNLSTETVMVVDCESEALPKDATAATNAFIQTVIAQGYPLTDVYASASWFWYGRLNKVDLNVRNMWVANYGSTRPGVGGVGTWQFTNNWQGMNVDMSYDFFGYYTESRPETVILFEEYIVQPGDSWWLISFKHEMKMDTLLELNNATRDTPMYPGMRVKLA